MAALRLLGLACLALALSPASAVVYSVTDNEQGPPHCNGTQCNIGGAWEKANGGDTILLEVNVSTTALTRSGTGGNARPIIGNLTIEGKAGANIVVYQQDRTGGQEGFISIRQDQMAGALVLKNFMISNFVSVYPGAAIRIAAAPPAPGQGLMANTVLVMSGMKVFGNVVSPPQPDSLGGAISVFGKGDSKGEQAHVLLENSYFENNINWGTPPRGSVLYATDTHVTANGCHFGKNEAKQTQSHQVPNAGGVVHLVGGNFHMNGGGFGKNKGINVDNSGVTIVAAGAVGTGNFGDVFLNGIKMMKNTIPPISPGIKISVAAQIVCNHLHVTDSSIDTLDFASTSLISLTADDQYFSNCALTGVTKVSGFGMYIRNLRAGSHTLVSEQGYFANCTSGKPWLPCPQGSECNNVSNNQGEIVAYDCFSK